MTMLPLILLLTSIGLFITGCSTESSLSGTSDTGIELQLSRPMGLDQECKFPVDLLIAEVRSELTGEMLTRESQAVSGEASSLPTFAIAIPAEHPVYIIVDAYDAGTPQLRGEMWRTFPANWQVPVIISMVPHPAWPGRAVTLIPKGVISGPPGADSADALFEMHFHVPDSLFALWAVMCWQDNSLIVDFESFAERHTDVLWLMKLIHEEDSLLHYFCPEAEMDRAVGILLFQPSPILAGFDGIVGEFMVETGLPPGGAALSISAAGWDDKLLNACLHDSVSDEYSEDELNACVKERFGSYSNLLQELMDKQIECRFGWDFHPSQ